MTPLYGRRYQLIVGTPRVPQMARYGNTGTASPVRMSFSVEKGSDSTPNKATIVLSNLAPHNRSQFTKGVLATLSVGYASGVQTLFVGVVSKAKSERNGPDIDTTLECDDGASAITQAILHKSYLPGVSLAEILGDVAEAMALKTDANPIGMEAGTIVGIPAVTYSKGLSVAAPCAKILTMLCRPQGLEWSVQNNALQIVPKGSHTGETAELLTPETGLLGVPSTDGDKCAFQSLLNPRLTPARLATIKSDAVNGTYKILSGKWKGDTHGQDWDCDLVAVETPSISFDLSAAIGFNMLPAVVP